MQKKLAPIALFVYNRPEHTKKTIEALRKNVLATQSELYIFSDAPRDKQDEEEVEKVRKFLRTIKGFKKIILIKRKENLGLADSIISGVTQIVNKFEKVIVLEDDILVSSFFLEYMNEVLDLYEKEKKVFGVSAYMYPVKEKLPETFFLNLTSSWGWATWKDRWSLFKEDGEKLIEEIKKRKIQNDFDLGSSYPYMKMLRNQIKGKNNSWAIRWYASVFLQKGLILYPKKSLVKNKGFDNSGTHGRKRDYFNTDIFSNKINVKFLTPQRNTLAYRALQRYFKKLFFKRVFFKSKDLFNNFFLRKSNNF